MRFFVVLVLISGVLSSGCESGDPLGPGRGEADRFAVELIQANNPTVGEDFEVSIVALDAEGDIFEGYSGEVKLSLGRGSGALSGETEVSGFVEGMISARLRYDIAEEITIVATDGALVGESPPIVIEPRPRSMDHFTISMMGDEDPRVSSPFDVEISAIGDDGGVFTAYSGTVILSIGSGSGALSGQTSVGDFVEGIAHSTLLCDTPGEITIRVTDGIYFGESGKIKVGPIPVVMDRFAVAKLGEGNPSVGSDFDLSITAVGSDGNVFEAYEGTVALSVVSGSGSLSGQTSVSSFQGGVSTATVRYDLPGELIVRASDGLYSGDSPVIKVEEATPPSWRYETHIDSPYAPWGLAVDEGGNIYVRAGSRVYKYDSRGNLVTSGWPAGGYVVAGGPSGEDVGLAVDDSGVIYVASGTAGNVDEISPDGSSVVAGVLKVNPGDPLGVDYGNVKGVAVDGEGTQMWVALSSGGFGSASGSGVYKFERVNGEWFIADGTDGTSQWSGDGKSDVPLNSNVRGVALDDDGNIYVGVGSSSKDVYKIASDGNSGFRIVDLSAEVGNGSCSYIAVGPGSNPDLYVAINGATEPPSLRIYGTDDGTNYTVRTTLTSGNPAGAYFTGSGNVTGVAVSGGTIWYCNTEGGSDGKEIVKLIFE
ncbi:MAG: hypothetical protein ACUVXI_01565 [bacterium]